MKKLREKRIESVERQIDKHKILIENEKGRKDTTKDYWKKEIEGKFENKIEEDKEYLKEN